MKNEKKDGLDPLFDYAESQARRNERLSKEEWDRSSQAKADVRRLPLIGSAAAIGLLASRIPPNEEALSAATGTPVVAVVFFAFAIYFAVVGRSKEFEERSKASLALQKYAGDVYRAHTSNEAIERHLANEPLGKDPPLPDISTPESDKLFAMAHGCMIGGGTGGILHLVMPMLSNVPLLQFFERVFSG